MYKQQKSKIIWLLFLSLLLILPGCARQSDTSSPAASSSAKQSITDDLNRTVEVPAEPKRVLALTKNMMDEIYELGITPVGKVEEYNNRAELNALPSVSNQDNPNLEAIYQLKPDLILANTRQHAKMQEGLEKSGAVVVFLDPSKVKQDPMTDEIVLLGQILNRPAEAQAYLDRLNQLCKELQDKIAPAGYKTGLLLMNSDNTMTAAQPTGVFGALLSRLGIENIVPQGLPGSAKSTWVSFDAETIIQKDPDVILIKASSKDKTEQDKLKTAFMSSPQWSKLKAVKNDKVFILPPNVSPGNCTNEEALKATAKIIYPAGFGQN